MHTINLGADPEFLCVSKESGSLVRVSELITPYITTEGFGADGHPYTGELRPGISSSALEMVSKIEAILKTAEDMFCMASKVNFLAGHYKVNKPLGGHIHLAGAGINNQSYAIGDMLDFYLIDCLDSIICNRQERDLRVMLSGYGKKALSSESTSGMRIQGDGHIEYRASGSWLISPEVAFVYLTIAKLGAELVMNGAELPEKNTRLWKEEHYTKELLKLLEFSLSSPAVTEITKEEILIATPVLEDLFENGVDWNKDFLSSWIS